MKTEYVCKSIMTPGEKYIINVEEVRHPYWFIKQSE